MRGAGSTMRGSIPDAAIAEWRREGAVVVPDAFTHDELIPVVADYERAHPKPDARDAAAHADLGGRIGRFDRQQFKNFLHYPFDLSLATNLLPLHPVLIDCAKRMLSTDDVFMYQCHTWAKFTGETDYTQEFHFDFGNHTLLVPGDEAHFGSVNYVIYLTDVTKGRGALAFAPRSQSSRLADPDVQFPSPAMQRELLAMERTAEGPAGSLLIYDTNVFHRGTNLTEPGAHRYTMTVSYRAQNYTAIGGNEWARNGQNAPWKSILPATSVEQASALGIPRPGHPYWTERTLRRVKQRYPDWDLEAYRHALSHKRV